MIAKDSVKRRLESDSGLSFTEFTYQLLQGYDFAHLHRHEGVQVQIGGADQWGNITAGTDLIRKMASGEESAEQVVREREMGDGRGKESREGDRWRGVEID